MNNRRASELGIGWVGGCVIGCLTAVVLLVAVAVGLSLWGMSMMESTKVEVAGQLERDVEEAREEGRISPEEAKAFAALAAVLKQPDTQPFAAFPAAGLFENLVKSDGEEREELVDAANDLRQFLSREESPGMMELMEFLGNHPTLSDLDDFEFPAGEG